MVHQTSRHVIALGASILAIGALAIPAFTHSPRSPLADPPAQQPQDELKANAEPATLPVAVTLTATHTEYVAGESPQVLVRMRNESQEPVVLVGSLDASDIKWRYPFCYFEIEGPPDAQAWGLGRCGNMNPLRPQDFVSVQPGKDFDPYARVDDYGFFDNSQMDWHAFAVPGKYRLTWVYSTASEAPQEWLGDGTLGEVSELLKRVPHGIARSNTVEINVTSPPEGYVPNTWIPLNHPEAANRGTWFLYKLLATGPLNLRQPHERYIWLFDGAGPNSPEAVEEFRQLYENLAYEIAPLQRAGHDVSRPTTLAAINTKLEIRADASIDNFDAVKDHFGGPAAVSTERRQAAIVNSIIELVTDERCQEDAVVVFVFTDVEFSDEDVPEFEPPFEKPQRVGIVRVARRNDSWIPTIVRQP